MRFFQASVNGETVYFKAESWYDARDLGRRLWPFAVVDTDWNKMIQLEEPPPRGQDLQVFELDEQMNEAVHARGYEFDSVAKRKPKKRAR